ncbi:hypothetical protein B0H11DRAFT_2103486 [Mycena galericulata]|nr:hypothetical protein B0H11DRAFT_2103486 [Mycena galericulata]
MAGPSTDEEESDAGDVSDAVSDADDGLSGDKDEVERRLLEERPHIVPKASAPTDQEEEEKEDYDPALLPSIFGHRRQSSSSSRGASEYDVPADTDFDADTDADVEEEDSEREAVDTGKTKKKSVQQQKYETERPQVRKIKYEKPQVRPLTPTDPNDDMSKDPGYREIVRLRFPSNGHHHLKLLDQRPLIQDVVREAVELGLYDIAFKNSYDAIASRAGAAQVLLRRAAKKLGERAKLAGSRAKNDIEFCRHLAPLIFARFGKLRNDVRNTTLKKFAAHYELTKPGITRGQVRTKIRALDKDQKFIYPYNPDHPFAAAGSSAQDGVGESTDVTSVTRHRDEAKFDKCFKFNSPFLAPAIADIIHDVWFANSKALGFKKKYVDAMVSRSPAHPKEKELPGPMICFVATNVLAALQTYITGTYVPASEFSQSRLETTYLSLMEFYEKQYDDDKANAANAKAFHKVMHQLYLNSSKSVAGSSSAASGSAGNVIRLDLDDDDE